MEEESSKFVALIKKQATNCIFVFQDIIWYECKKEREKKIILATQNEGMDFSPTRDRVKNAT